MSKKVLGFDVSKKNTGVCFRDRTGIELDSFKFKSLADYYKTIKYYIDKFKPDIVAYSGTVMMFHTRSVKPMVMLMAIVELACENRGVKLMVLGDTAVRKELIGKNAKKIDVLPFINNLFNLKGGDEITDGDRADSALFSEYVYRMQENSL